MFQQCMVIGNLGKDPETRYLSSGTCVCKFSVATTRKWKDKQTGEQQEKTTWFNVETWGKLGEVCAEYLRKGSKVHVSGEIETGEYEDREGVKRYTWHLRADTMTMLGNPREASDNDEQDRGRNEGQRSREPARQQSSQRPEGGARALSQGQRREAPPADDFEDDIPF